MSLTIRIPDALARRLQSRAEAEKVAVDELAARLLATGMQSPLEPEQWTAANQRRVALIEKRFHGGLSDNELQELQHLQELADRQLEELDTLMLSIGKEITDAFSLPSPCPLPPRERGHRTVISLPMLKDVADMEAAAQRVLGAVE